MTFTIFTHCIIAHFYGLKQNSPRASGNKHLKKCKCKQIMLPEVHTRIQTLPY